MRKIFTTYEQQIDILKSRNLIISDEEDLKNTLKDSGYYNLINGYSYIFQNNNDEYINNASDKDIYALYRFDKSLRNIIYKYTLSFESRLKSMISYVFSEKYGEDQNKYLIRGNFDKDINKEASIAKLISDCFEIIKEASDGTCKKYRHYIGHYVNKHGHVPLWVLIRAMTLGNVSVFYANMKLEDKNKICSEFNLKASELEIMLKMLVQFRNVVAHDERIFCYKLRRDGLPGILPIYDVMKIKKSNIGVPYSGVKDFLSLMIIFKYLLKPIEFAGFWTEFELERDKLIKDIKSHFIATINDEMGLKNRWKNIKNYKI
jgi:abortive infection bacteriophage resistance protein